MTEGGLTLIFVHISGERRTLETSLDGTEEYRPEAACWNFLVLRACTQPARLTRAGYFRASHAAGR